MKEEKIILAPINSIKENKDNPRLIKDEKFKKLVKSIKEFPQMLNIRPIVVNEENIVLGGNMRLKACKEAGLKEVPILQASNLTAEQQKEFIIKDNVGFGEWDWDILANEWDELQLQEWGIDLPDFVDKKEVVEDDYEIPDEIETDIIRGDLFEIGEHRMLCGDSTNADDVAKLMNGEKAELCHADPPYGMGKEKDGIANDNLYNEKLDQFQMAWWRVARSFIVDNGSAYIWGNANDLWRLWYVGGLNDSERLTFRNEIVWYKKQGQGKWSASHRMYPTVSERCLFFMLGEQGFNNNADKHWEGWEGIRVYLKQERLAMGWDVPAMKRAVGHSDLSGDHWTGKSQWNFPSEYVYKKLQQAANGKAFKREYDDLKREFYLTRAYFDNTHDGMTDVWEFGRVIGEERFSHATPKPVEMIKRIIKSSCPDKVLIYEPFLGSGTTMVAAHQLQRKCYGMEIEPKYCQVIIDRMKKLDPELKIKKNGIEQ